MFVRVYSYLKLISNVLEKYLFLDDGVSSHLSRRLRLVQHMHPERTHDSELVLLVDASAVAIQTQIVVCAGLAHESVCSDGLYLAVGALNALMHIFL